ncbi:MAG: hypothetical protein LM580_02830 [Thermofilum sp.]|nr:hypothetical protein [Thermofilum sp.]MCC6065310.1 hypothetical protein [Thermofilum sp.]
MCAVALLAYYSMASGTQSDMQKLGEENKRLSRAIPELEKKLSEVKRKLADFKLPAMKVKAYKVFIPVGFADFDGRLIALAPPVKKARLEIELLPGTDQVLKAIDTIARLDRFYRETFVRERWDGAKIVGDLEKQGLWSKVQAARSPEHLLLEEISRDVKSVSLVTQSIKLELPLLEPDRDNIDFLKEALSASALGRPDRAQVEGELELSEAFTNIEELKSAAEVLAQMEDFAREAGEALERAESYRDLFSRMLELVRYTLPLEQPLRVAERVYCAKCASREAEELKGKLDLMRWIEVNVIGGVSEDPDIVVPPERFKEDVREAYKQLQSLLVTRSPLPGLEEGAPPELEEALKLYSQGLSSYAVLLSGADRSVVPSLKNPFSEPVLTCRRCGSQLTKETAYTVPSLKVPFVKAYAALLYEFLDKLFQKSETIRLSVNQSRLSKDQRKTGLGAYESMVHEFESKKEAIENELKELEHYEQGLTAIAAALGVSEAVFALSEARESGRESGVVK